MYCDGRPVTAVLLRHSYVLPYESDEESGAPLQDLTGFLALPSMKRVKDTLYSSCGCGSSGLMPCTCPCGNLLSNREEVALIPAAVNAEKLEALLEPLSQLRIFR